MASLSHSEIERAVSELKSGLVNAHLEDIYQPDPEALYLSFWKPSGGRLLFISVHPLETRVHLVKKRKPNPPSPHSFQMFLRKHIKGMHLSDIACASSDRRVALLLEHPHKNTRAFLVAELFHNLGRVILLNGEAKTLRVMGPLELGGVKLKSGVVYEEIKAWLETLKSIERASFTPAEKEPIEFSFNYSLEEEAIAPKEGEASPHSEELRRALAKRLKKAERTLDNVRKDLERAKAAVVEAKKAEWIKPYIGVIKRGMKEFEVETPEGKIKVALDPALSPAENIEKIFNLARRLGKRVEEIEVRISLLEEEKSGLEKILMIEGEDFIARAEGFIAEIPARKSASRGKIEEGRRLPYREFYSSTGARILVGRGGKDNHELTFKVASHNDYWLHVKGFAGSHTIIVAAKGKPPDEKTAREAAELAAYYSKAPMGEMVEVALVRRSFVKPMKGAPGKVTYVNERTIAVVKEARVVSKLSKPETKDKEDK